MTTGGTKHHSAGSNVPLIGVLMVMVDGEQQQHQWMNSAAHKLENTFSQNTYGTRLTNMFCEIVFPESWVLGESKTSVKNCSCCAVLDCC